MAENLDKPRPAPFTERIAAERFALIFSVFAIPMLAIALGIGITIVANALR